MAKFSFPPFALMQKVEPKNQVHPICCFHQDLTFILMDGHFLQVYALTIHRSVLLSRDMRRNRRRCVYLPGYQKVITFIIANKQGATTMLILLVE
jgi:hypothetical protein